MPIAHLYILSGRTEIQKKKLVEAVDEAIRKGLELPPEALIEILIHEVDKEDWGRQGILRSAELNPQLIKKTQRTL